MFRLVIELEAVDPPLSRQGPTKATVDVYVTNRMKARREFDRLLELMGLPSGVSGASGADVDPDGTVWP
jgi:hypothetical protein